METARIKIFSMFSGIGGFEKGIIQAIGGKAKFVGYSEIDRYAIQIYERHFGDGNSSNNTRESQTKGELPSKGESATSKDSTSSIDKLQPAPLVSNRGHKNYGDCTQIEWRDVPDFDLLVGGVPCQAWSIAGKRKGFEDSRGTLWFEYFRCLKEKQPSFFVAENVKGLLSHNQGRSFEEICVCFSELGYAIDFEVLNSKNFGVPQNRERVFIIGVRLDLLDNCQVF